ncbi:MAG: hypothetical protein EU539_01780 [Promethearchaeota archaeon]|nr:MAG: hypothetical protein EU539_01780 [Candidatus Lokiarchaeota archaeon]
MSDTIKINLKQVSFEPNINFTYKRIRSELINFLTRNYSLVDDNHDIISILDLRVVEFPRLIEIPELIASNIIQKFLNDLKILKRFFGYCKLKHDPTNLSKMVNFYLHKIHRIAPVFNFKRAKINLKSLYLLFSKKNFWPQISTQLAIIIYITDKLDKNFSKNEKLMQKNIRLLCNCSAYAFHRTRKKLEIDEIIRK